MREECVAGAVTNAFGTASDDCDFAFEIGRVVEVKSLAFRYLFMRALDKVQCQHIGIFVSD